MQTNNSKEDDSYDDEEEDEDLEQYTLNVKQIGKNQNNFMQQINQLNEQAVNKIKQQKHKEALKLLQQAEQMLEFTASCGRIVDRNLIIIILYNQACAYQCQWVLDKCSKYLDGVIYNMEIAIKEDEQDLKSLQSTYEKQAQLIKRQQFLTKAYLQYTAILSQLGKHKQALINSQKAAQTMRELFKIANIYCQQWLSQQQNNGINLQHNIYNEQMKKKSQKDEYEFSKLVIDSAQNILKDMNKQVDVDGINQKLLLKEIKKMMFYWKRNLDNNENSNKQELKLVSQNEEYKALLGIQNLTEWIKNFNIGSIMHMAPLIYDEFTQFGEMIYELAKRQLLEKVIFMSISYFTIATELRFVELEKAKQQGLKDDKIDTQEFKLSDLYHLKAIEIACKHITTQSPYISHLLTSYQKHYNVNLDDVKQDSIQSNTSEESNKQKQQQQSRLQIQINTKDIMQNQKQQDQSPKLTGNFIKSFLNSRSPPKQQQTNSEKLKNELLEQILNSSNSSPKRQQYSQQQQQQQKADFDFSIYLKKQSNPCNISNNQINKTFENNNNGMTIQLQPHKQQQNNNQLKSLLNDFCRTERQVLTDQNHFTPISYRMNNRSPDNQRPTQNKTPQNRPRTNTEQQCINQSVSRVSIKIRDDIIITQEQKVNKQKQIIFFFFHFYSKKMSVYSGFATRQLESQYNKLITSLLKILQRRIIKFYKNEKADEITFKRVVEETLTKLNQMEHQKYNEPYISAIMGEICDYLQIQQTCSTGCACQCHLQQRKQTFLTQDKEITSNPSSCRRNSLSSKKQSINAIIDKPQHKINQISQISQSLKSPYPNNPLLSKQTFYQNNITNFTHNSSMEKSFYKTQRPYSKSPQNRINSRMINSRANPNESLEEKRHDIPTYGQVYQRIFRKRFS